MLSVLKAMWLKQIVKGLYRYQNVTNKLNK